MYLAINKHNRNEYHSFVWDEENNLIINWVKVNPNDWDIIEVFEKQKTRHQDWDSYGVFCIAQMIFKNNEPNSKTNDLDLIWSDAIYLYERFLSSEYNVDTESELDCIYEFMKKEYNYQFNS